MWELDCEEGWVPKNWCFWTVVLEKTLKSPLDCREIQPVDSEGDQPWNFFGRNDAEAETPVLWPPHAKSWLIGKDCDAGRDRGQEEKGTTEDEMAWWQHWLDGRESGWTPGVCDGQGGLACCDSWGHKESDTTERLIWFDLIWVTDIHTQPSREAPVSLALHSPLAGGLRVSLGDSVDHILSHLCFLIPWVILGDASSTSPGCLHSLHFSGSYLNESHFKWICSADVLRKVFCFVSLMTAFLLVINIHQTHTIVMSTIQSDK